MERMFVNIFRKFLVNTKRNQIRVQQHFFSFLSPIKPQGAYVLQLFIDGSKQFEIIDYAS